jgi:AAA family ATP:ADP antiporter
LTPSDRPSPPPGGLARLSRIVVAEPHEILAVVSGFLLFFLLFAGYFMLRPVRETMGIAGGVDNLHWLFLATFLATLVVVPFYGWLSGRVPRRRLLPIVYSFFAVTLAGFAVGMWTSPDDVWLGRSFYVWISVYNLFVVSMAWSLMADLFRPEQAKRLFGQIAAGASLGGLAGPLAGGLLVPFVGHGGLLMISAGLLVATLIAVRSLLAWRAAQGGPEPSDEDISRPLEGGVLAGLTLIVRSPYLLGISAFVVLLASVSTFLYFEQARLVEATFSDRVRQTQVFSAIDVTVQSLTIFIQLFVTGRLTRRFGVTVLLSAVPIAMILGFGTLAAMATFPVLVVVMILRRVGEYALVRPGREMLFTTVDAETKYKAKNAVDTVVYRGGDAVSAWLNSAVGAMGAGAVAVSIVGAVIAAAWAALGYALGRAHDRRSA